MTQVHTSAQQGFTREAQAYVRGRPDYPAELLGWLRGELGLGAGRQAVDLGAGTGKFTKLLLQTGAAVTAVEPVDAMRAQLAAALPAVRGLAGTAQAMPLDDASADAVLCAQAFHWFARREALAEIHRVLRPGGQLGLVWNVRDESVDWVARLTAIVTPYEGDTPRFHKGDWRRPFDDTEGTPLFTELRLSRFAYQHVGTPQEVIIDRFLSVSFIAALPPAEHAAVARELHTLVATHPALRGRETIAFPYETQAYRATRR